MRSWCPDVVALKNAVQFRNKNNVRSDGRSMRHQESWFYETIRRDFDREPLKFRWSCDAGCHFNFFPWTWLLIMIFWLTIGKATGSSSKAKMAPPSVSLSNPNLPHSLSLQMCCGVSGGPVGMWWNVDGREGRAFFNVRICHNTGVLSSYAVRRFENVHPFLLPKVWCGRNQGLGHHKMSQHIMMIWRCYKEADIEMRQRCLELCWEAQAGELVILTDLAPSDI